MAHEILIQNLGVKLQKVALFSGRAPMKKQSDIFYENDIC
jgi:hypothetical protein